MRNETRLPALLPRLALGLAISFTAGPAFAGPLPWVGLSAHRALVVGEKGEGHLGAGPGDYYGFAVAAGDFDGNGADDLAAGVPGNDCDFVTWDCGTVVIRYSQPEVGFNGYDTLTPEASGAPDAAEEYDEYGSTLAVGDFNGDKYEDLAIGVRANAGGAGGVLILYGSMLGLPPTSQQFLRQGIHGTPGQPGPADRFGWSLAVGDFDADGFDDLAIGAPFDNDGDNDANYPFDFAGTVTVVHGSAIGILPDGFLMKQGDQGLPDTNELGDHFGYALSAGDFDGDGYDDLAIGVEDEDGVGAVLAVYGSENSLIFADHFYFGNYDLGGTPQPEAGFGAALAAGDFDGDGRDDLAIGSPGWDAEGVTIPGMGMLRVVWGSSSGLSAGGNAYLWEDVYFGPGNSEAGDQFAATLLAADLDGDGLDELVVGVPREGDVSADSGAVLVVRGQAQRELTLARRLRPGDYPHSMIPDDGLGDPWYGFALAAGDFDGNGHLDLAIGAPRHDDEPLLDTGSVAVVFGSLFSDGFETGDSAIWSATEDGLVGLAQGSAPPAAGARP